MVVVVVVNKEEKTPTESKVKVQVPFRNVSQSGRWTETTAQFANERDAKDKFDMLMQEVKKLCVSYGGLVLNPDEEIQGPEKRGCFQYQVGGRIRCE